MYVLKSTAGRLLTILSYGLHHAVKISMQLPKSVGLLKNNLALLLSWVTAILGGMAYFLFLFIFQKVFTTLALGTSQQGYSLAFACTLFLMLLVVLWQDRVRAANKNASLSFEHQPATASQAIADHYVFCNTVKRVQDTEHKKILPVDYSLGQP